MTKPSPNPLAERPPGPAAVGWTVSPGLVDYPSAIRVMEERAALIAAGRAPELVWLLEHPPLYTAGTSARPTDLLDAGRFPIYPAGRGGQYTYHGPGQRVVYTMIDLRRRKSDVRAFVESLERWIILTLARFGVRGEIRCGRVGVWVPRAGSDTVAADTPPDAGGRDEKIAAIGIRVRRWVAFHGFALNVATDLGHFSGIVPCGIAEHGVTSLHALGREVSMADVDAALRATFAEAMGDAPVFLEAPPKVRPVNAPVSPTPSHRP